MPILLFSLYSVVYCSLIYTLSVLLIYYALYFCHECRRFFWYVKVKAKIECSISTQVLIGSKSEWKPSKYGQTVCVFLIINNGYLYSVVNILYIIIIIYYIIKSKLLLSENWMSNVYLKNLFIIHCGLSYTALVWFCMIKIQ